VDETSELSRGIFYLCETPDGRSRHDELRQRGKSDHRHLQRGTPRVVFAKTRALATIKRHDYLLFGEELNGVSMLMDNRARLHGGGRAAEVHAERTRQ